MGLAGIKGSHRGTEGTEGPSRARGLNFEQFPTLLVVWPRTEGTETRRLF